MNIKHFLLTIWIFVFLGIIISFQKSHPVIAQVIPPGGSAVCGTMGQWVDEGPEGSNSNCMGLARLIFDAYEVFPNGTTQLLVSRMFIKCWGCSNVYVDQLPPCRGDYRQCLPSGYLPTAGVPVRVEIDSSYNGHVIRIPVYYCRENSAPPSSARLPLPRRQAPAVIGTAN